MGIPLIRRKADGTMWTPAGDTPHPIHGFNFVPAVRRRFLCFRWWAKAMSGPRWVFSDHTKFDYLNPPRIAP